MDMFYLTDLLSDELHELDQQRQLITQSTMDEAELMQQMQLQPHGQPRQQDANYSEDMCEQENNSSPESTDSQLLLSSIASTQPSAALLTYPLIEPATKLSYASIVTSNHSASNILRTRQMQPQAIASAIPRISSTKTPTNRKPQLKPRSSSKSQSRHNKTRKQKNDTSVESPCTITTASASSFFSSLLQLGSRPIPPITASVCCTPFSAATMAQLESISPASKLAIGDELDAEVDQSDDIDELDASISDDTIADDDASYHDLLTLNLATPSSTKQLTFEALSPYSKEISKIIEEEGDYEDLLSSPVATESKYDIPADNTSTPPLVKPNSINAAELAGVSESDMASIRMAEQLLSPPRPSAAHSRYGDSNNGTISPLLLSPMSGKAYQLSKSYTPPRGNQHQAPVRGWDFHSVTSSLRGISQRGFFCLACLLITVALFHVLSVFINASSSYDTLLSVSDWDTVDFFGLMELGIPQLLRELLLTEFWPGLSMKYSLRNAHLPVQQRFLS